MKKKATYIFIIFLAIVTLMACKKEEKIETTVEITVIDSIGNNIENAMVWLYLGNPILLGLQNSTRVINDSLFTDKHGKVFFDNSNHFKSAVAGYLVANVEIELLVDSSDQYSKIGASQIIIKPEIENTYVLTAFP